MVTEFRFEEVAVKKADPFYSSLAWHKLRAKVRANWKRAGQPPCPDCRQPITGVPVADHFVSRRMRPDLALVESNIRIICHPCNTKKGIWEDNSTKPETGADGFPVGGGWGQG